MALDYGKPPGPEIDTEHFILGVKMRLWAIIINFLTLLKYVSMHLLLS